MTEEEAADDKQRRIRVRDEFRRSIPPKEYFARNVGTYFSPMETFWSQRAVAVVDDESPG